MDVDFQHQAQHDGAATALSPSSLVTNQQATSTGSRGPNYNRDEAPLGIRFEPHLLYFIFGSEAHFDLDTEAHFGLFLAFSITSTQPRALGLLGLALRYFSYKEMKFLHFRIILLSHRINEDHAGKQLLPCAKPS
jgi:hypothetical protein